MTTLRIILFLSFCSLFFSCQTRSPDTYIKVANEGCFGAKTNELFFYKQEDSTLVTLREDGKEIKHAIIGEGQIAALSYFRQKIEGLKGNGFSTITQHFTIRSGSTTIDKVYYGYCDDFERLKAVLFVTNK